MTTRSTILNKKFAFFLPGLYEGGAERIMLNLAQGIAEKGYPVDLVLSKAEGPFMNQIPGCVHLVDLNCPRVLASLPALVRYIRQERPSALLSVLHANLNALWAYRLAGVPMRLVLAEHNTLSSVAKGEYDIRFHIYPTAARWFYPWSDAIVAVSDGVAKDLAQTIRMPLERIQVIYNPIVTPELFEKSQAKLDHPWYQPGQPPVMLAIGRLTAQKAFDVLLKAFAEARKERELHLVILGEGEDRAALEAQAQELGLSEEVRIPGFVSNPYPYIAGAAAFVLSSRWEGLPTVLVEALALGTPIISTDCPSGPREILQGGKLGRLVPVENPHELAQAMLDISACPKAIVPPESWAPFALDSVVDQYIKVLLG